MFATLAGGYPFGPLPGRTGGFDAARRRWSEGRVGAEAFASEVDAYVREIVAEQEASGLDMVEDAFACMPGEGLEGLASGLRAGSVGAEELAAAWRSIPAGDGITAKVVLPGPWTIASGWSHELGRQTALRRSQHLVSDCLATLASAGCVMVMLAEPALVHLGDDPRAWRDVGDTLAATCRDAAARLHLCLAITGGAPAAAGHEVLAASPFASHLVDVTSGPVAWAYLAALPPERGVIVGALDATSDAIDDPEMLVWAAALAAASGGRGAERVGIAPTGSLASIDRHRARRKVEQMGVALQLARLGPLGEVARALQPDPGRSSIGSLRRLIADHDAALGTTTSAAGGTRERP